jgi:hypothetical protein
VTVNSEYMLYQLLALSCQNCLFLPSHLIRSLCQGTSVSEAA